MRKKNGGARNEREEEKNVKEKEDQRNQYDLCADRRSNHRNDSHYDCRITV